MQILRGVLPQTKYRHRILKNEVGGYTERLLRRLAEQKEGLALLELNVQADHVHMVVILPKYAVSEVMGYLKGKTAVRLFQRYKSLGKQYWGRPLWSRGYCVSTVGLDEEKIRKYVKCRNRKIRGQSSKAYLDVELTQHATF